MLQFYARPATRILALLLVLLFQTCSGQFRSGPPWAEQSPHGQAAYSPMFSRYTPYLTEDSLPEPSYGRIEHPERSEIYRPRPSVEERSPHRSAFYRPPPPPEFEHRRPEFEGSPEYPEPFSGPHGETRNEETEERPQFLPPHLKGQRLPPPEAFRPPHGRPFFGPIPSSFGHLNNNTRPYEPEPRHFGPERSGPHPYESEPSSARSYGPESPQTSPYEGQPPKTPAPVTPPPKSSKTKQAAPEYGSDVQLPEAKSRPERLFAIRPPEFPAIPSPPPYPSLGTPPPPIRLTEIEKSGYTARPSNYTPESSSKPSDVEGDGQKYNFKPFPYPLDAGNEDNSRNQGQEPENHRFQGQQQPQNGQNKGKNSRTLPSSFRNFFPPGFGPFAERGNQ